MIQRLQRSVWMSIAQCRFEAAVRLARDLVAMDPDNPYAFQGLCSALTDLMQLDEAVVAGVRCIELEPQWASAHFALGRALHYGESEHALRFVEEAIRLNPDQALYYWALSAWYLHHEDGATALETAERGLALNPHEPDCLKQRALALAQLGREADALAAMDDAFSARPDWRFHEAAAGWVHYMLQRMSAAEQHLRRALIVNPLCSWSHEGLGLTLLATGNRAGAIEHLHEVLRICPYGNLRARKQLTQLGQSVPPLRELALDAKFFRLGATS